MALANLRVYLDSTPADEEQLDLFQEIRVDQDQASLREFSEITNGARTVPQITIDGKWIGSFSELTELHMDDKLDDLMQ